MNQLLKRVLGLWLWLSAGGAGAAWIEPGEAIELDADEGLAVFGVDSDSPLDEVKLDRIGSVFSFPRLEKLNAGHSLRLLKLPAGDYEFHSIRWLDYIVWKLAEMPNVRFTIKPGRLNYVGSLTSRGMPSRVVSVRNSALAVRDELGQAFPGLPDRYPWHFAGAFPDPFIEFMSAESKRLPAPPTPTQTPAVSGNRTSAAGVPAASAEHKRWARRLFKPATVQSVTLSPAGNYALEYRIEDDEHRVDCIELATGTVIPLFQADRAHEDIEWLNAQQLVLTHRERGQLVSQRFTLAEGRGSSERIPLPGLVLSVQADGRAIYASNEKGSDVLLHRVDLTAPLRRDLFSKDKLLLPRIKRELAWVTDAAGEPRLASFADSRGRIRFGYRQGDSAGLSEFELPERPNEVFGFAGFDAQGQLLAFSNHQRKQIELVKFDPLTGKIGETVFARPGVDLRSAVRDHRRVVVGVRYIANGRIQLRLFNQADKRLLTQLVKALPGRSLEVSEQAANGNRVVFTHGAGDPGTYYVFYANTRQLELLSSTAPWLEETRLGHTERLLTRAADGFEIESFLTRIKPAAGERQPLLVMPHGGPIGAFDLELFDAEVQYLAKLGYAVLRVNYRGSGNRDKADLEKGHGQWGRGIESDINHVVDTLLARGDLDPQRIVAVGTSYGGYSAIMLSVLHPQRYRAAVSIAGVSDPMLFFTGGRVSESAEAQAELLKIIGDPRQQEQQLREIAPVYRYRDIQRPLLLVHDRGDQQVNFEHAERLKRMLALRGIEVPMIVTDDGNHGLVESRTAIRTWPRIAAFLEQVLRDPPKTGTETGAGVALSRN